VGFSIAFFTQYDLKWGGRKHDQPEPAKLQDQIVFKSVILEK
jgi:hypothetical protein